MTQRRRNSNIIIILLKLFHIATNRADNITLRHNDIMSSTHCITQCTLQCMIQYPIYIPYLLPHRSRYPHHPTPSPSFPPNPISPMSSEDDEDQQQTPRQALPLASSTALPAGVPATAEQYLTQVRAQSALLPSVLCARPPPPRPHQAATLPARIPHPPPAAIPHPQWQQQLLATFTHLQSLVSALPPSQRPFTQTPSLASTPTLSNLLPLDHIRRLSLLRTVDQRLAAPTHHDRPPDALDIARRFVHHRLAEWTFCLLVFFPKYVATSSPIHSNPFIFLCLQLTLHCICDTRKQDPFVLRPLLSSDLFCDMPL